jgi:hypothetical protein
MGSQRWLVAVLAISTFSVACEKKKKTDATTGSGSAAEAKKDDGVAPKKDTPPAQAQSDLQLIPVDSEAVFGVNFGQLLASGLWKQFIEPEMMKDNDFMTNMKLFKDKCGFDPMASVKNVSLGMKGLGNDKPDGVAVIHGLDKAKTLACADKWQAEAAKEKVTIKKDGDVVLMTHKDGTVAFTFISGDRLLMVMGTEATPDGIKKAAQGGSTLATSPAFVDMYGKINKDQSLWFLMNGNSKIFEEASSLGLRPKAVFGSLHVTDALSADVRARLDSADQATQTVNNFKGQVQAMASMVDKLDFTADGPDVKLAAAASNAKLQNLFKMMAGGGM